MEYGSIQSFGNIIINEIKNYRNNWIKETNKQRKNIKIKYSEINEKKTLLSLCKKINYIFWFKKSNLIETFCKSSINHELNLAG